MATKNSSKRKNEILQALALMLEKDPGERITTAKLAKEVGVSEAALYRHFPSKARMFEGLIEFTEEAIFSRMNIIAKEQSDLGTQCQQTLSLILTFASRNPGICRLLTGEALSGEHERLRGRISQLFNRVETQIKQLFRQHEVAVKGKYSPEVGSRANLLVAVVEGRIQQYVRTDFTQSPLASWDNQWQLLSPITGLSS
ncbi:nucleoid occlusion factor SlmA [Kangiella sediminilitoris]|uniref:Nucleoid occlusion factor SlmA n=1 Tax=Kangiella sediminilitoris TaxID=1144748 RepID=A0A1B3B8I3_9GAMM|nr:nucleoid occlusion factor SlmA [Kangiella sediminilitoris]AOE49112.1 TetR family transcriptional regulator [Kangiella sediminilitoris]